MVIFLIVRECLFPSAVTAYLSPLAMSFELHCHFTLTSDFSVSASKTTTEPSSASRVFGFLVNAETKNKESKSLKCKKVWLWTYFFLLCRWALIHCVCCEIIQQIYSLSLQTYGNLYGKKNKSYLESGNLLSLKSPAWERCITSAYVDFYSFEWESIRVLRNITRNTI